MKFYYFAFFSFAISNSLLAQSQVLSLMPENDLHLQAPLDNEVPNVSEEQFNSIIDKSQNIFGPIVGSHNVSLMFERMWNDDTVNANASKIYVNGMIVWKVTMYGGLAKRWEMSADGLQLVICHELGHHLGGYTFYNSIFEGMSSEGQSDYYSTQACLRAIWKDTLVENKYSKTKASSEISKLCDSAWKAENDRAICARSLIAAQHVTSLFATLQRRAVPQVETPDQNVVVISNDHHPDSQCRLDTYVAGAICQKQFDLLRIPGIDEYNRALNTPSAEVESNKFACNTRDKDKIGVRPKCWFANLVN